MTQTDNHLNATLAAAATRDSSAMKTLAFLTALFLPGTYVAVRNPPLDFNPTSI